MPRPAARETATAARADRGRSGQSGARSGAEEGARTQRGGGHQDRAFRSRCGRTASGTRGEEDRFGEAFPLEHEGIELGTVGEHDARFAAEQGT